MSINSNFRRAGDPPIIINGGRSPRQPVSGMTKPFSQSDPPIIISGG